jgi:hypothetical protein
MEFVKRLTEHDVTPFTFRTAFSTRVLHAAQLIPVTLNCLIVILISAYLSAQNLLISQAELVIAIRRSR